jgi:NAD(P) transhydrogenase subunit alpha
MHADFAGNLTAQLYILVLSTFVGFEVIRRVSPLLHTPLMSLTNAISAIAVVGSIVIAGRQETTLSTVLGTLAVTASMINVVGGYLITYRMVKMFKKRETKNR